MDAQVTRDGPALVFSGRLDRSTVPGLWRSIGSHAGEAEVARLDAVASIDSAGIALLAELAARTPAGLRVEGNPTGLADLRAAYRLGDNLRFI